jgi:hypothetical protein
MWLNKSKVIGSLQFVSSQVMLNNDYPYVVIVNYACVGTLRNTALCLSSSRVKNKHVIHVRFNIK